MLKMGKNEKTVKTALQLWSVHDKTEKNFLDTISRIAEMGYENCGISPFKIDKLGEIAASFVNRAEQDSYFTESKDKMNKIEKYKEKLR